MAFWKSQSNEDAAGDGKIQARKASSELQGTSVRKTASGFTILLAHRITEKTAILERASTYVFQVGTHATKLQVKEAIEAKYGVNVIDVRTINSPGKELRRGKQIGWKSGIKKAMIKLKEGETIEAE